MTDNLNAWITAMKFFSECNQCVFGGTQKEVADVLGSAAVNRVAKKVWSSHLAKT